MSDFRVRQIDHVELFVPDQREAATWYRRVFGLEIVAELEHWAGSGPLMMTTVDAGTKLALFRGEPAEAPVRAAFRRVAFAVDGAGFAAFLRRVAGLDLRTAGGQPVGPDDWTDHGESWSIYFDDPWGHGFEITTYDVPVDGIDAHGTRPAPAEA